MQTIYDDVTPESIKAEMLAELANEGVEVDVREGSYSNILVSQAAYQTWKLYQRLPALLAMAVPDENSGIYIDKKAADINLVRTKGTHAAVLMRFIGVNGSLIPADTALYAPGSGLCFRTAEDAVIDGGIAEVTARAAEIGVDYNVPADTITAMGVNLRGVDALTNPEAAAGGTDDEGDEALYRRLHDRLSLPASSGNPSDYVLWAREVSGVAYAHCVPIWNGPGTVKVIIADQAKLPVDETVVAACAANIEAKRVIGPAVTVVSVSQRVVSITAVVVLAAGGDAGDIQTELTAKLAEKLAGIAFAAGETIRYSQLLALLLTCDGLEDYTAFSVNDAQSNIVLQPDEVPVLGVVSITAGGTR